jgi:hypothetical protein
MRTRHSPLKDQVAFLFDQTIRTRKIQTMSQPIIFVYLYCMESKDVKCTFSPNLSDAFADQRVIEKSQSAIRSIRRVYPTSERNPRRFVDGGWWIAFDPNYISFARMLPNLKEIDTITWRITCICLRNVTASLQRVSIRNVLRDYRYGDRELLSQEMRMKMVQCHPSFCWLKRQRFAMLRCERRRCILLGTNWSSDPPVIFYREK